MKELPPDPRQTLHAKPPKTRSSNSQDTSVPQGMA
jgi:hypothetical protein